MDRARFTKSALIAALMLVMTAAFGAPAQAQNAADNIGLGFKGLGARLGLVDPEGASSTLDLGIHIDAGEFARNLHLQPIAEYWSVGVEAGGFSVDISDFSLGMDLLLDFPLQDSRIVPYAGGGLGMHFLKYESNVPGEDAEDSRNKLGLNLQGGVRNDVMPNLALFGEVRYNFISDANQLKLLGGFTYRFVY